MGIDNRISLSICNRITGSICSRYIISANQEELYVIPEMRSQGLGKKLFSFAEDAVSEEAEYVMLSMAAKNWKPLLRFYTEELGMEFWSARLFRRL